MSFPGVSSAPLFATPQTWSSELLKEVPDLGHPWPKSKLLSARLPMALFYDTNPITVHGNIERNIF